MQTVNDLCKRFEGFSKESRIVIHLDHGDSITRKWEEACRSCYTVKQFKVIALIANIIVLEIWN